MKRDESGGATGDSAEFPEAEVRRAAGRQLLRSSKFWLLTLACAALAVVLVVSTYYSAGPQVKVHFQQGHGLKPGDLVRHRGIDVGEVVDVALSPEATGVVVTLQLEPAAATLAREGTRFWIARPEVSLARIRGLDTVVGAKYVGVTVDGPPDAPPQSEFAGLERPPDMIEREPGGLEVVLESGTRAGIEAGSPVTYRGLRIGDVVNVGLASDASQIETRIYIRSAYRNLVRENSVFWSVGGIDVNIGLTGFEFTADPLSMIAEGGVAMATPEPTGRPVAGGARFTLGTEPSDWADWRPRIPVGSTWLIPGGQVPRPLRVALRWREKWLGFPRARQATGWGLLLEGGRLIGPAEILSPPDAALPETARIEFAGSEFPAGQATLGEHGELALCELGAAAAQLGDPWPLAKIRAATSPEECLLIIGDSEDFVPLTANRLTEVPGGWQIDSTLALSPEAHGAAVVAASDGSLIGIARTATGPPRVVRIADLVASSRE